MIAQTSIYIPHTPTKNYNEKMFKETLEKVSQLKIGFSAEDVIEVLEMCYKTIAPIYASRHRVADPENCVNLSVSDRHLTYNDLLMIITQERVPWKLLDLILPSARI